MCGLSVISECSLEVSGWVRRASVGVVMLASVGRVWSGGHQWACSSRLSTGDLESISWCSLEKIVGVVWRVLVGVVLRSVDGFGGH